MPHQRHEEVVEGGPRVSEFNSDSVAKDGFDLEEDELPPPVLGGTDNVMIPELVLLWDALLGELHDGVPRLWLINCQRDLHSHLYAIMHAWLHV